MTSMLARSSVFDDFFRDFAPGFFVGPVSVNGAGRSTEQAQEPMPIRVDVAEADAGYAVHAELPGVNKDDIHVTIDGDVVTLRAEVKPVAQHSEGEQNGIKWLRVERRAGQFARSFRLPAEVDSTKAEAKYDNGVLRLSLPKKLQASAQRLSIQ